MLVLYNIWVDLKGLERTNGNFVGKTWNFWCYESMSYNFIWEIRGNNLGISGE